MTNGALLYTAVLENNKLETTTDNSHLYKRYVNNFFIICDNTYDLNHPRQTFNKFHTMS